MSIAASVAQRKADSGAESESEAESDDTKLYPASDDDEKDEPATPAAKARPALAAEQASPDARAEHPVAGPNGGEPEAASAGQDGAKTATEPEALFLLHLLVLLTKGANQGAQQTAHRSTKSLGTQFWT